MEVLTTRRCRVLVLSLALLCCTELLPAQTNCDSTSVATLPVPAGLRYTDTLLRESGCTPGPMGTRTPLILIHGLDGTSIMPPSSTDLLYFEALSLNLAQDTVLSNNYKIFTFNYLSNVYTVAEIGADLETWLDYFRTSWDPYGEGDTPFDRDIVIITHSMGGLVARALMNENTISAGARNGQAAGERVIRAITLAAPHHGTGLVNSSALRMRGQSPSSWPLVLSTMDLGWVGTNANTNIAAPNRGDLLCDQYCATHISALSYYTGADVNGFLDNLPTTYNYKVNAYYGTLGSHGAVATYGADTTGLTVDVDMGNLALALGEESLQPSNTAGLTAAELANAHALMQLVSVILERIDSNNWSGTVTSVSNDGAVPDFSGSFAGATVAKRVSCVTSDHADMLEGTGGSCTDQTTSTVGPLYQLLDADLESIVPANPVPAATSLSPSSATAGGAAFTLTVNGTNFVSGATIQWNGSALATSFVNSTQLTAAISASDVATAGTVSVTVANPSPGGATSGALTFTINAPPSIAIGSVSVASLTLIQGGGSQSVTVSLTRTDYTDNITLAASTLPSGVTATYTQPGTGSSGSISLQAAGNAALVTGQTITITASGSGVSSVTSTFSLTVSPPASIVISSVSVASLTLIQGGSSQSVTVNLTRTDYTDNITLAASTLPSGVTATYTQPGTGSSGSIGLQAAGNAALVTGQTITITASGSGVSAATSSFTLTVNAPPSIAISSVSPSSVTLVQGGSAQTVTVNLTATNYTGSVTLVTSALPNGVTATYTQPGTGNLGSITLQAANNATPLSGQTVAVTASGSGVSSVSATFSLTVSATPSIAISSVSPSSVTLVQGGSAQTVTVNLTATNYTGSVTLTNTTLPSGVTATYTQPGTGTSGSISLQAASSAALVTGQTITITASGSGVSSVTATFNLTVSAPASIAISSVSPSSVTLIQGGSSQSATVNLTRSNYTDSITLSIVTLPSGVTATYTQPGTGNSGSMSLQAASNAALVSGQTVTVMAGGSGASSVSATFSLTVNPTADFSLSVSPTSYTVTAGGSATYTLSVTPAGGFNQQVALSCTGAPSAATCSISPSLVTLGGTNAAKPTVTVTTTARSLAGPTRRLLPPGAMGPLAIPWVAWLLVLATLSSLAAMRRRRVRFSLAVLAATVLLMISWVACGGGLTPAITTTGTPAGTYTLTISGTYVGASGNLTNSAKTTLTVN